MPAQVSAIKRTIQRGLYHLGYEINKRDADEAGELEYGNVRPWAEYSPWNGDAEFMKTYHAIESHTLIDRYRCYELWQLVEESRKLDGAIIEVGVWKGGTGAVMAKKAQMCGIKDPVYLCDTFTGVVKAGENDSAYQGGEHADTTMQCVQTLLHDRLGLDNFRILQGIFPDDTAHLVEKPRFRLSHIDVDVYQSARDVVEWLWDRLIIGGMVVYDDYGFRTTPGITRYVNEQRELSDRLVIHNLNGHAVVVKIG